MPTYEQLTAKHPTYDARLWRKAKALHAGGEYLLKDREVLKEILPKHLHEHPDIYEERLKRAFYLPYAAEILNSIISALFASPLEITKDIDTPEPSEDGAPPPPAEPVVDDYYADFFEDCSPPKGDEQSFHDFLRDQLIMALLCRCAWTLVDFPEKPEELEYETISRHDEDEAGLADAYVCQIDPEHVYDWHEDPKTRELRWVNVHHVERPRNDITGSREMIIETFTVYYPDRWARYQVMYEEGKPPQPGDEITQIGQGEHTFGCVPLIRLDVGDKLWLMNKIMSVAIAHFNLRNALSWAEYKSLFPVMVAFKEGNNHLNPLTQDPDRDLNQVIGQGYIMSMAAGDRVEYVGPDSAPYQAAMQDLGTLKDEMHRVVHQVAMSVDNTGAAMQRSGDSRALDYRMTALLLGALADIVKEHSLRVLGVIAEGRLEQAHEWVCLGMDDFEDVSIDSMIAMAQTLDTISLPSATFKRVWCFNLAQKTLGDTVTQEQLDEIRKELEENISNEDYLMPTPREMFEGPPPPDGEPEDEEKEEEESDDA